MLGLPIRVLVALLIAPSLAAADTKAPQPVKGTLLPGVVVEEVGNAALRLWDDRVPPSSCAKCWTSGAAEKAGIKPGEILLSWERGANPPANPHPARGDFQSPFDVREVEIEQAPRGRMTLVRASGGPDPAGLEPPSGEWGVGTTPRFTPTSLKMFLEGKAPHRISRYRCGCRLVGKPGPAAFDDRRARRSLLPPPESGEGTSRRPEMGFQSGSG